MDKATQQKVFNSYFKLILISSGVHLVFRIYETFLVIINFGIQKSLFVSEIKGLVFDLILTGSILAVAFPLYYLVYRFSEKFVFNLFVTLIVVFAVSHFFIINYFAYQLSPLDTFVLQYSMKEIIFTLSTSDVNYLKEVLALGLLLFIVFWLIRFVKRMKPSRTVVRLIYGLSLFSIPVFTFLHFNSMELNKFTVNKSFYFYSNSIPYILNRNPDILVYTSEDANNFWNMYSDKAFINREYPLLHSFENKHTLHPFFRSSDTVPNIVILIIEGLNDDFVHPYKGVNLMPFLQNLKSKSLYWNRCFTLGERSFAVVPSLLGSLPYGEKGFTLLDRLPRHLTLASLLHENGYYTSFFYGQGSWFHKKDRFFKYNNIDLIFDNKKFSDKYKKIIVGKDKFFWGYNDKDLFRQSFEVLDTIKAVRRLDIYYTGTSHSPFVIDDVEHYDKNFSKLLKELRNKQDVRFFKTYKKFIQSVLFVDDALKEYFESAKSLPGYENTVFLITGDHPMTEIPIENSIKRYHVPLIIYSPGLNNHRVFTQTVSHLDIYETLLSFLSEYQIKVPEISSALGGVLNTGEMKQRKRLAFMNDNREIIDYYSEDYFLSGKQLFRVGEDLSLTPFRDRDTLKSLLNQLEIFKKTSLYVSQNDKIINDSLYCTGLGYKLISTVHNDTNKIRFNTEYFNLIKSVEVKNQAFYYDISFNHKGWMDEDLIFVYQLTTKNDSVVFWKSNRISDASVFQVHNLIPKQNISDTILYLNSYFRNKNRQDFEFEKLRILVFTK